MSTDEQQIRELVSTWMSATQQGQIDTVLELMTDDAVFLVTGQKPMLGKAAFAAVARAQGNKPGPRFEGRSEIQEIRILGDWAFMWTRLTVTVTPATGEPFKRAGNTLSILTKQDGRWRLARDANMLAPVSG